MSSSSSVDTHPRPIRNYFSVIDTHLQALHNTKVSHPLQVELLADVISNVLSLQPTVTTEDILKVIRAKCTVLDSVQQEDPLIKLLKELEHDILSPEPHFWVTNVEIALEEHFPYHKALCLTTVKSKLVESQLYDVDGARDGSTFCTALVTKEEKPGIMLDYDQRSSYPFDKVSFGSDKVHMVALLYNRFATLAQHFRVHTNGFSDPSFVSITKGIIGTMNRFEENNEVPWLITEDTIVVRDGCVGDLICLSPKVKIRTNDEWSDDFLKVSTAIGNAFTVANACWGFQTVHLCMSFANSKERRNRLLKAPYFLQDKEKMLDYIPNMFYAASGCASYRDALGWYSQTQDWYNCLTGLLCTTYNGLYREMEDLLHVRKYNRRSGFSFLEFLRDCVLHLSDVLNKRNKARCKQLNLTYLKSQSTLMMNPKLFFQIIDGVDAQFLDNIFYWTYMIPEMSINYIDCDHSQ